jgi:proline dehydrogenase
MEWPVARRVARRFVAGETLDEAIAVVRRLEETGFLVSLDHVGEAVEDDKTANEAVDAYLKAAARLEAEGLTAELSIKPSSLADDPRRMERILQAGRHVTLDMEDHTRTDATLDLFRAADGRAGVAVQANLRRTEADVTSLLRCRGLVRLTKGAYAEPPSLALTKRGEVNDAYDRLTTKLFGAPDLTPAIATHDLGRILWARATAAALGRDPSTFELQMLYGVRRATQEELRAMGYRVRIYVPYGDQWYPYLMRRLAERPANLLFFARALLGT